MRTASCLMAILLTSAAASPVWAQDRGGLVIDPTLDQLPPPPSVGPTLRVGQISDSSSGQAGVRQTRDQIDGLDPMARINNRIQNRVQSRVRNRIDRNYDSRANSTSPFEVADQATRTPN